MIVVIAGGRDYLPTQADVVWLDQMHEKLRITKVISGGANGADLLGENWSKARKIELEVVQAEWNKHGNAAGPIRNIKMGAIADALLVFPGGRGTAHMISVMERSNKPVFRSGQ